MKTVIIALVLGLFSLNASARIQKISLQASGLTCSMCSKAVLNALKEVDNVTDVKADIKNQEYHISFNEGKLPSFDALAKAVEDAGFSVASFTVSADLEARSLAKDEHLLIDGQYFHFLNGEGKSVSGSTVFKIVDKAFTSAKSHQEYSSLSTMSCVRTGKMESCCTKDEQKPSRIFHVII